MREGREGDRGDGKVLPNLTNNVGALRAPTERADRIGGPQDRIAFGRSFAPFANPLRPLR